MKEYSTAQLEAEIKRRREVSDKFASIDTSHFVDQWVVTARGGDRDWVVGYYKGNPIDISLILGPRGYGLVFTPVNFKQVTVEHILGAEPKPSSITVEGVTDQSVQRYFKTSELFDKLPSNQKSAVGIVRKT